MALRRSAFIAGDWGTTQLRLFLCDDHSVLASRSGKGIGALSRSPAEEFAATAGDWFGTQRIERVVLCGMVGSRNGWHETTYVPCPASFEMLRAAYGSVDHEGIAISIVPGLSCVAPTGAPDVMRGEETQIFGAMRLQPRLAQGRHVLALPGTHTKWVVVADGRVMQFQTALTGELFALLKAHSTLLKAGANATQTADPASFADGLEQARQGSLLHRLFQVRSRQLIDGRSADQASSLLSGLLLGSDVDHARQLLSPDSVTLIGEPGLASLYAQALQSRGIASTRLDGNECALAALRALASA
jgi:2-dehydro-3-deoxygalactonokinase